MNDILNDVLDTNPSTDTISEVTDTSETKELTVGQLIGLSTLAGAAGGGLIIGIYEGGCWVAKKIKEHKANKAKKLADAEAKKN